MTQFNFDARGVVPDTGILDPVPEAWYNTLIEKAERKPTSNGQGAYIELTYNVMDGQFKGRKLFNRFNTENSNPKTVEIAYRQLSAVCHAVNELVIQNLQQFNNKPLKVRAIIEPGSTDPQTGKQYPAKNDVRGWKNINEPTDPVNPAAASPYVPAQQAAPGAQTGWQPQPGQMQGPAAAFGPGAQPQQAWSTSAPAQPWQAQQPQQGYAPPPAMPQQPAQPPAQPPFAGAPQQPWQQGPAGAPQQPWQQQQPPAQPPAGPPAGAAPQQPWQGAPAGAAPPWQNQ